MAHNNQTWGEERIANELRLKLGVSPRTVGKYVKRGRPNGGNKDQRWTSFLRNQAKLMVACEFLRVSLGGLPVSVRLRGDGDRITTDTAL